MVLRRVPIVRYPQWYPIVSVLSYIIIMYFNSSQSMWDLGIKIKAEHMIIKFEIYHVSVWVGDRKQESMMMLYTYT